MSPDIVECPLVDKNQPWFLENHGIISWFSESPLESSQNRTEFNWLGGGREHRGLFFFFFVFVLFGDESGKGPTEHQFNKVKILGWKGLESLVLEMWHVQRKINFYA